MSGNLIAVREMSQNLVKVGGIILSGIMCLKCRQPNFAF